MAEGFAKVENVPLPGRIRFQFRLRSLFLLVAACTVPLPWLAWRMELRRQERAENRKRDDEAETTATTLRQTISEELSTLVSHEWAGSYYQGDGLGVNVSLMLAPKAGFLFEWHGCMDLYDRNYGPVEWSDGKVHFSFTFPNNRGGFKGIADRFIPVDWTGRKYLVAADDVLNFCNDVNNGFEPRHERHGRYLLRRGDETKVATGFPIVPDEFKPFILPDPIQAEVVGLAQRQGNNPPAIRLIVKGSQDQGLRTGMRLWVVEPDGMFQSFNVTKVEGRGAEAVLSLGWEEEPGPQIGWTLSTRLD